ncbi:MAG: DUF2628 domain-containing protein [Pseudomonadota bacterium]
MTVRFVILEKPDAPSDRYRFVRDGFSVIAVAFPMFWLLYHRQWLPALAVFLVSVAASLLLTQFGMLALSYAATVGVGFLVALEGGNWRQAALQRAGFFPVASLEANSVDEAELRFADLRQKTPTVLPPVLPTTAKIPPRTRAENDILFADGS